MAMTAKVLYSIYGLCLLVLAVIAALFVIHATRTIIYLPRFNRRLPVEWRREDEGSADHHVPSPVLPQSHSKRKGADRAVVAFIVDDSLLLLVRFFGATSRCHERAIRQLSLTSSQSPRAGAGRSGSCGGVWRLL